MLGLLVEIALAAGAVVVLLYQGTALLFAYQMPRLDPAPLGPTGRAGPTVSVVIAARNEAADLPATLDGLRAQEYDALEVVVVDGGSTDGTAAVVAARAGPALRRVEEPPLPPGWIGKSWACWTGARATAGEWLLFLDADVRLHPAAVRTLLAWAEREGAELATIAPRIEMVGFWERTVLPLFTQLILVEYRAPRANRPRSRAALANGQCWLIRRSDYEAIGGHAAVRDRIVEDVAIAQRARTLGRTLRIAWAPELATTRMYRDRHELYEGMRKISHGIRFSAGRQAGRIAVLIGLFWLPLLVLPLGVATGAPAIAALGAGLAVALFGKHAAFARATGAPAAYGLLYPVAIGFFVVALADSLGRGLRRGTVPWKGRSYSLRP